MSWEYWSPFQRMLNEALDAPGEMAKAIIAAGYAPADNEAELTKFLAKHENCWADDDYDGHCDCGKWIEFGQYDMEDHLSSVLEDSGLLYQEDQQPNVDTSG